MAKSLLSELIVRIKADKDATVEQTLKSVKNQVEDLTGTITDMASKGSLAFGAMSAGGGLLIKSWLDSAGAMEVYKAKLTTVLKSSSEAEATMARAVSFAAKTPFDVKGIVDATVNLEVFGQSSEKWLPLTAQLAAGMGKDIEYTGLVMGKALTGSMEGLESLRNQFGMSTAKLAQYGATLDRNGGITVRTIADQEKLRGAIEKIINMDFSGAIDRYSKTWVGATSNLNDAFIKLKDNLGRELIPTFTGVVRGITGVIEAVNQAPSSLKALVSWGTVGATAMAGLSAGILGIVAVLPFVTAGLSVMDGMIAKNTISNIANTESRLSNLVTIGATPGAMALATSATNANTASMLANANAVKGSALSYPALGGAIQKFFGTITGFLSANPLVGLGTAIIAGELLINGAILGYEKDQIKLQQQIKDADKDLQLIREGNHKYVDMSVADARKMGITISDLEERVKKLKKASEEAQEAYLNTFMNTSSRLPTVSNAPETPDEKYIREKREKEGAEERKRLNDDFKMKSSNYQNTLALKSKFESENKKLEDVNTKIEEYEYLKKMDQLKEGDQKKLVDLYKSRALILEEIGGIEKDDIKKIQEANIKAHEEQKKYDEDQKKQAEETAKKEIDEQEKVYNAKIKFLDDLKAKNQLSVDEEIKGLKRILQSTEITEKDKEATKRRLWGLESQQRQQKIKAEQDANRKSKEAEDKRVNEAKQAESEKAKATQTAIEESRKEIESLRKDAVSYDISELTDKLKAGEDVEAELVKKIKQRTQTELDGIEKARQEMMGQGVTREEIEEKIGLLKQKAYREESDSLKNILESVKKVNEEKNKDKTIKGIEGFQEYQSNLFAKKGGESETQRNLRLRREGMQSSTTSAISDAYSQAQANISAIKAGSSKGISDKTKAEYAGAGAVQSLVNVTINLKSDGQSVSNNGVTSSASASKGVMINIPPNVLAITSDVAPLGQKKSNFKMWDTGMGGLK